MYSYEDEVAKICGVMAGRPETPVVEIEAGRAIERAFRELIQNKYLYQKQEVDLKPMLEPVKEAIEQALIHYCTPQVGGGRPVGPRPTEVTPTRFAELCKEVSTRPWILATRHMGDSDMDVQISKVARTGVSQPLGSPIKDMHMGFLLPSVQLQCLGVCKSEKTFSAHAKSRGNPYSQPWSLEKSAETEQLFFPIYRCEGCSKFAYTMLVKRKGLKLQLCGISPRRPVKVSEKIPKNLSPILQDAEQSVAEGDLFAAIYHLRTLVEHYVKGRLGLPLKEKRNGDELIALYNATIAEGLKSTLPSLLASWQFLSEALHAREGKSEDYTQHRDAVCQHIEVIALLGDRALTLPEQAPPIIQAAKTA